MPSGAARAVRLVAALLCAMTVSACSGAGLLREEYEYEEELYLALDGSATLNVNASVAALVALRGADLDVDPIARIDRNRVRALFEGPGVASVNVSLSRREGRRFVHVSVDVDDIRRASQLAPFAWSVYRFERKGDAFEFRQAVGRSAGRSVGEVGWTGREMVLFKMHLPSEILFHNSPSGTVERGNILEWAQPLRDRLGGAPLDLQVDLETESILFTTLVLFGTTVVAAGATFVLVVWWIARRGRDNEMAVARRGA
jgi:hypothetical protein